MADQINYFYCVGKINSWLKRLLGVVAMSLKSRAYVFSKFYVESDVLLYNGQIKKSLNCLLFVYEGE